LLLFIVVFVLCQGLASYGDADVDSGEEINGDHDCMCCPVSGSHVLYDVRYSVRYTQFEFVEVERKVRQ